MKILQTETTQNQTFSEDLGQQDTKYPKIAKNGFIVSQKQVKKNKKIIKIQKKTSLGSLKDEKESQNRFLGQKSYIKTKKQENFGQNSQLFNSQGQFLNLPSVYEKVSQFFFESVVFHSSNQLTKSKSIKKVKQNMSNPDAPCSIRNLLTKLRDQFQIKVLNLLNISQKLLFKYSKLNSVQKYQNEAEAFLSSDIVYKHSQNHRCKLQNLQQQIMIILRSIFNLKSTLVEIENNPQKLFASLKGDLKIISPIQEVFIKELHNFQHLWQKQISHKINQTQDLKDIAKILIVLLKCYKTNNCKIQKMLAQAQKQQQNSLSRKNIKFVDVFSSSNQQFYTKCLIKKCLIKTFSQEQTLIKTQRQLWNFFKKNAHLEQSIVNQGFYIQDSYVPIETEEQFREYIKRITNRKIFVKTILHTNCKACFSSHFQRSNPIIKCPQCKYRVHKSCGKVQDRCDRCNFKKLGASLKQSTKKCFICLNETNSLMLCKMKGNKFAHNFCLMVHNLWTVENNSLALDLQKYSSLISSNKKLTNKREQSVAKMTDQKEQKVMCRKIDVDKTCLSERKCKFCSKESQIQKEFLRKCSICNESCHILCAYLNGCKVQITEWKQNFQINLEVTCCPDSLQFVQKRKRLEISRKYKINYENFAINLEKKQIIQQTVNFTQNFQTPQRKLTTANMETEVNNGLPQNLFQLEKVQELIDMNV